MAGRAIAVIGAGYGDEAKGAFVSRAAGPGTLVVRHNGGAQAGHTVVTDDGRRHVFHHVGSGAFEGASTWFGPRFISNPMALAEELADLAALGVSPSLAGDPRGLLTTPYDMIVNRIAEQARGPARHGSCGLGIGETVERSLGAWATTLADLADTAALGDTLRGIRDHWVPARLEHLGASDFTRDYAGLLEGDALPDAFLASCAAFARRVRLDDGGLVRRARHVVFEGAQGLLLDQDRGAFPFVTRSNTGLKSILDICGDAGIADLDVRYATRCYATRHGAGPLPGELAAPPFPGIVDPTNIPNAWQGRIRFAHLDSEVLVRAVSDDLSDAAGSGVAVTPSLALSCLDQAPAGVPLRRRGGLDTVPKDSLLEVLLGEAGFSAGIEGHGAARSACLAPRRRDGTSTPRPSGLS